LLFNTLAYAKFFAIVFAVSWLLVSARRVRLGFLLLASYYFYQAYDYRFLLLIFASSTADFWLGNAIAHATTPRRRKHWLLLTVVMNLGILAFFKYANFGAEVLHDALRALGLHPSAFALAIPLPIGISFFTFESMSYVIDVYRGDVQPQKSYLEYLTFVAFFPHLVAGPIVRPRDLLPQLAARPRWDGARGSQALLLIGTGLFKKIAIGDYLALNLVDRVFDAPVRYSALECYVAVVAYAVQIYSDFSGYTDIAIGSAELLGVRFPNNFDAPYTAYDVVDFWRRWHISLSTWLRDYLYIPLGGNRRGRLRTYFNLLATMVLGGLWHGAKWTYVMWGALHGVGLALNRALRELSGRERPASITGRLLGTLLTFHFVLFAWIFFRADDFRAARVMLTQLATLSSYHPNLDSRVLAVLALGLVLHVLPARIEGALRQRFGSLPAMAQGVVLFCLLLVVRRMASSEAVPFVYFQF
jgi:D-alanyl-lipoteichoic acid acyltransferase DltB (MBOAT superfamily)